VRVVLVETAEDAAALPDGDLVVALTPAAEIALERADRPFTTPAAHVSERDVLGPGRANYAKTERMCETLDELIAAAVPLVRHEQLRPARWHYMPLKAALDGVWLRSVELRNLLTRVAATEVVFARPDAAEPTDIVDERASIYASVLDVLLPALGIAAYAVPVRRTPPPSAGAPVGTSRLRSAIANRVRRLRARPPRSRGLRILCADRLYGIPPIAGELRRQGHEVRYYERGDGAQPSLPAAELLEAFEASAELRRELVWDDVDWWPALAPRLRALVEHGLPQALGEYAAARDAVDALAPDALLTSMAALAPQKAVCAAARRAGVPTIVSRHGEVGTRDSPMPAYQDVDAVDWALCWGSWEAAWVERHAGSKTQTVVVGSPYVEQSTARAPARAAIRRRLAVAPESRCALYVPTALAGNWWYEGRHVPLDRDYIRQGGEIIDTLLASELDDVLVKELPTDGPSPLEARSRPSRPGPRLRFIGAPPFSGLIHLANAVVLDAPSTALVQALFGSARIYIVDYPLYQWEPGVAEHLTSCGVVLCPAEALGDRLAEDRVRGIIDHPFEYPAHARDPLASTGEQPAAARAAAAIVGIAARGARG